ncbi:MAG: hypothetical protein JXB29_11020 [Sedimentisphaerales bacterium]|nr:hypothetical protein [Sedimentisphaerales bacterium]
MANSPKIRRFFNYLTILLFAAAAAYFARGLYHRSATIHQLLAENKHLKQAITNLTHEDQIGYAKVISQQRSNGRVLTTIKFVETAREDKLKKILEKDYTIQGDIIHFDALIVKFGDEMVMNGQEKALYIWRRVYGENMSPEDGMAIETYGGEPQRYKGLLKLLMPREKELFWSSIWQLANDPDKLNQYGIKAVYGNVVYSKLREGLIYVFKITPAGQLYPEVVPDM